MVDACVLHSVAPPMPWTNTGAVLDIPAVELTVSWQLPPLLTAPLTDIEVSPDATFPVICSPSIHADKLVSTAAAEVRAPPETEIVQNEVAPPHLVPGGKSIFPNEKLLGVSRYFQLVMFDQIFRFRTLIPIGRKDSRPLHSDTISGVQ